MAKENWEEIPAEEVTSKGEFCCGAGGPAPEAQPEE